MKCEKCGGRGFTEREHGLIQGKCLECDGTGEIDDISNSGTGQTDNITGSADTSQPKQPKKRKTKKKAGKKSG